MENYLKMTSLLFCIILTISCNKRTENNMNYFDFDELESYHKEISTDDITKQHEKMIDHHNNVTFKILEEEYPKIINDSFINELIKFDYKKKIISNSKYKDINMFFSKRNCDEFKKSACAPIYRDVLIFKKNDEIIGIAKICFRCETGYIIGLKQNLHYFGECGNYKNLQNLIK